MKTLLLALCFVVATSAHAAERADLTLLDGTELKRARIVAIGETQVHILHEGGMAGFATTSIPPEALARAKAAIEGKTQDPERQADEALARERTRVRLAKEAEQEAIQRSADLKRKLDATTYNVVLKVFQVIPGEGFLARGGDVPTGEIIRTPITKWERRQGTGLDSHKVFDVPVTTVSETPRFVRLADGLMFVSSPTEGMVDGQLVRARIYRSGTYRYTSVQSAGLTIPRFFRVEETLR